MADGGHRYPGPPSVGVNVVGAAVRQWYAFTCALERTFVRLFSTLYRASG